jgi:hypothetical protein
MISCLLKEYFTQNLPPEYARSIIDNIDVVPAVLSLDCSMLSGLGHLGVIEFCPQLNIIIGRSGSGMTRILEALKSGAGHRVMLPPLPRLNLSRMSPGMLLMEIIGALVEIQPTDSCLLLDDVFDCLDKERTRELIGFIALYRKQVILASKPHRIEAALSCIRREYRSVEGTDTVPSLIQCWC